MRPQYVKLKETLRNEIKENFKEGDLFYSQNYLMKKYRLSYATVTRALNELEREGYIYRVQGKGTFVAGLLEKELSNQEVKNIGIVFRNIAFLTHPYVREVIRGIEGHGLKKDYHFFLYPLSGRTITRENGSLFFKSLENRELDGIIMLDFIDRRDLSFILDRNIPVVCAGYYYEGTDIPSVLLDENSIGERITEKLILSGHKRIGVIVGPLSQAISFGAISSSLLFIEGYKNALQKYKIEYDGDLVKESDFEGEGVIDLINELFSLKKPPDAVILIDESMEKGIKDMGRKDTVIKVLKFSKVGEEIGEKAISILEKMIEGEEILNNRIVIPFKMEDL